MTDRAGCSGLSIAFGSLNGLEFEKGPSATGKVAWSMTLVCISISWQVSVAVSGSKESLITTAADALKAGSIVDPDFCGSQISVTRTGAKNRLA